MGMCCCCGVKRTGDWVCECDWDGWYLCFPMEHLPKDVPLKDHPDADGTYLVRVFEDDYDEDESEFSLIEKNWGQPTNQMISRWKIEYTDNWTGYRGVYAWKERAKYISDIDAKLVHKMLSVPQADLSILFSMRKNVDMDKDCKKN